MVELDKQKAVDLLNRILEAELAGIVRYTHYSFLVFGHNRIPIVSWLREQAAESLTHAQQAGEMITLLGEYPSLAIGPLLDSHQTDIAAVMRESLETEAKSSVPIETCKLYFDKYRISYRPQLNKGELGTQLKLGWDFDSDAPF